MALYYVENENVEKEELEVRDFVVNGAWKRQRLRSKVLEEMVEYIMENIKTPNSRQSYDIPRWTGNTQGKFTVKSSWEILRSRRERKEGYKNI